MINPKDLLIHKCPDLEEWRARLKSDDFQFILSMTLAALHSSVRISTEEGDGIRLYLSYLQDILEPVKPLAKIPTKTLDYSNIPQYPRLKTEKPQS